MRCACAHLCNGELIMAQAWVFLADPEDFGWTEMLQQKETVWDGVKNAVAQRNMGKCAKGDIVLIYHTSPDKAIVGIAKVVREAREDPKVPDRVVVDVATVTPLKRVLPLAELKEDDVLKEMSFVKMPRVAVQPVTDAQLTKVLKLSGTKLG
jgi:predicted RNA-binding protein with PUA-like domain